MKLFHANLSSGKQLAASHSNPMSNSFIFIIEIHVVCCLTLGFLVCLREYWSVILAGVPSERRKRSGKAAKFSSGYYLKPRILPFDGIGSVTGGDIWPFDIENRNSQQLSLERVYRVFWFFHQCLGVATVQKYAAHITVKGANFYLNGYVSEGNLFHQVHDINCKYFSLLYILFSI